MDANVEREGAFTIPAKIFLNCIKTFSKGSTVTIEVKEPCVLVTCGRRKFSLKNGCKAEEFPHAWRETVEGTGAPCMIGSDMLRQRIKEVQFVAANDDSRPVFTAICLHVKEEQVNLVTANAFSMALATISLSTKIERRDASILVPVLSMRMLADVVPPDVPVVVVWDANRSQAVFQAGYVQVVTRLIEGTFPHYMGIVPKAHETTFQLARKELEQVVKAFKPFAVESSNIFQLFYTSSGMISFHAESDELGEADDEVEATVEGEDGYIIFNVEMLIGLLKCVAAESFTFFLSGPNRPGVVAPTGRGDHKLVFMPMSSNR